MSLVAGVSSYVLMTREARLGLNGAEVIEQESGIEELADSSNDRALIWAINGGEQRVGMGAADELLDDDAQKIAASVRRHVEAGLPRVHRSDQIELYRQRIAALDVSAQFDTQMVRESWGKTRKEGDAR